MRREERSAETFQRCWSDQGTEGDRALLTLAEFGLAFYPIYLAAVFAVVWLGTGESSIEGGEWFLDRITLLSPADTS
jgi:hypothetical protein